MNKLKVVKLIGAVATVAAFGLGIYGTWKAYPVVQKSMADGDSKLKTAAKVAKKCAPAVVAAAVAIGGAVAVEKLGKAEVDNLKTKATKATKKYKEVSQWYDDQSKAIKEEADPQTQEAIRLNCLEKEEKRIGCIDNSDVKTLCIPVIDPDTGIKCDVKFDISMLMWDAIMMATNRDLRTGGTMLADLFDRVAYETKQDVAYPEFVRNREFGWGYALMSAFDVEEVYLDYEFVESDDKSFSYVDFLAPIRGELDYFQPQEDGCSNREGGWW